MTRADCLLACHQLIQTRRHAALAAMTAAQEAANGEGKSSAGDKYETARAMAQNDRDRAAHQLAEADELAAQLARIAQPAPTDGTARLGSYIHTDKGYYLLGVGLGRISPGPPAVYALSPAAPAAKLLLGAKPGQTLALPAGPVRVLGIE